MKAHRWDVVDATLTSDDTIELYLRCTRCGAGWNAFSEVSLPGDGDVDDCIEVPS